MREITVKVDIPFPSEREAECAYDVLRVDQEPRRSGVDKDLSLSQKEIKVTFYGPDARKVRVAVTSFFESLILVIKTMKQFGPPKPTYSHYL